ncbi:restriction endonuclease subunit S [uncultured Fibrobacter sp.]|uniref:restriction endonuclease subunit S n=1 Tax=uncultured Fibrobacter sp. TaxID=261512 RepID=UPI0025E68767|nr:restriction endonuclease subunit S [uncultured Fibrobacter sp.]
MKRNWEYKKLGDVASFRRGLTYAKDDVVNHSSKIVLRSNNINLETSSLNFDDVVCLRDDFVIPLDKLLRGGDIFICMSNGSTQHLGKVAHVQENLNMAFGGFMGVIEPNENLTYSRYVFYCCRSGAYRSYLNSIFNGANINNLKWGDLSKFVIPVPPLSEQSRIVAELDLLTGIIDKQNAQLKELNSLAQAIFYDMFGDPIENPKGWEVKKLGDVCSVVNGLVNPNEEPFCNYPHIGGANIQSNTGVFVDVKLAKDEGLISGKYLFDESMILYSKIRPNLNKVALPSFKGICSADMYPLITNTDVANKYYIKFSITHKKFIEYAVSHSGRANIPKINRDALLAYDLPLPPLALQQSFAEKIQSIEKQKETIRASIADTQKLLDYTMDKYFG